MLRVRRGVYRLVHFPAGEHEEMTALRLWSDQHGVFSHQTALALRVADRSHRTRSASRSCPHLKPRVGTPPV